MSGDWAVVMRLKVVLTISLLSKNAKLSKTHLVSTATSSRRRPEEFVGLRSEARGRGAGARLSRKTCVPFLLSQRLPPTPSLHWQSISNEVCNSSRRRRIQVRQYRDHITWPGADLQLAIHPGCATAMAEASRAVD